MHAQLFAPEPRTSRYQLERYERELTLKYRDYGTAQSFQLRGRRPTEYGPTEPMLEVAPTVEAPQKERMF